MESWITTLAWVPRGSLAQQPLEYEMNTQALEELQTKMQKLSTKSAIQENIGDELAGSSDDDDDNDNDMSTEIPQNDEELMKALGMDDYTDDSEEENGSVLERFLTNTNDYVTDEFVGEAVDGEDDDEDAEDNMISSTDSIILVGQTVPGEDDCFVEVYCYNNETNALYVHHDIQLPADPICLQYLSCNPLPDANGDLQQGAFVAVGSFAPGIEIWNLDVMNPVEPVAVLGGYDPESVKQQQLNAKKSTKKVSKPKTLPGSHTDAVMSLSWHPTYPARLLSSSADKTIKLWDITTQECVYTYTHHPAEVSIAEWNVNLPNIFLAASQDGSISIVDIDQNTAIHSFKLIAPPAPAPKKTLKGLKKPVTAPSPPLLETCRWNSVNPNIFYAARTNGTIECFDIRKTAAENPVWSVTASDNKKPITSFATNALSETLFVTVSEDKYVKVWDAPTMVAPQANDSAVTPVLMTSRMVDVGRLFTIGFDKNDPFVIACGGDAGCVAVWDLMENIHVNKKYKEIAENKGLGDQSLTQEHIQEQLEGGQSKGIGPGRLYRQHEQEDYDSDDDFDLNAQRDEGEEDEDYEDDDDRMELDM